MSDIKAEDFKPKVNNVSDFYSWNLYRWLRKQDKESCQLLKKTKIYKSKDGALYIGSRYDQVEKNVSGFRLRELCSGLSNSKFPIVFWHPQSGDWEDVTKEFYTEYKRIGVCAIHGDLAHDFEITDSGEYRICRYCEKVEHKKVEMVEKVSWEAVE